MKNEEPTSSLATVASSQTGIAMMSEVSSAFLLLLQFYVSVVFAAVMNSRSLLRSFFPG